MSSRSRILVLAGIVAALVVGVVVVQLATGGESDTGVKGSVVSGCRRPPPPLPACPERPLSARQRVVRTADSQLVKEFQSGEDGSFEVDLDPGAYVIEAVPNQGFVGRLEPADVVVPDSGFATVRLFYDTGIG
ncbi:MAG TPA: hypothetical protein VE615_01200 [Gaiellaceae bacterium]|jgi:hypothetical protein|nr:hypothetical protein [Gaiellaceae bacterium]